MIEAYLHHEAERRAMGIPPLPLDAAQACELCELLIHPPADREELLLSLLRDRIPPGVDPAARVKADFLAGICGGEIASPLVSPREAVRILGTMLGGYNVRPLMQALSIPELAAEAIAALSRTTLVYEAFDELLDLSRTVPAARTVLESW
ncbi:MAG: aconitate hydratase B, partial [Deltaproteobacteria bacterium HGW-Deltaproteobacteria-11]